VIFIYICYSRLWKTLLDKSITKTELCALTGISTRVLAKLSKNETVTTDTIARICTALHCDVSDIMECVDEEKSSLYEHYKSLSACLGEGELYRVSAFEIEGKRYKIYSTKMHTGKGSQIHCRENGTVYLEELFPFGGLGAPTRRERVLVKPEREKDEICVVVIKGTPAAITGLDEGIFVSSQRPLKTDRDVYVMTEIEFKLFEPIV